MTTCVSSSNPIMNDVEDPTSQVASRRSEIKVTLLTGGFDKPYAFGLAMTLAARGVCLDVIGSDVVDSPEMHNTPGIGFLNLRGSKQETNLAGMVSRVLLFYARLFKYAATAKPKIFHILWNNKIQFFDRTFLMVFYKLLGKKIVFTAHNVNAGKRDLNDSFFNRLTLRIQYRLSDHIFVHTERMKQELQQDFGVAEKTATVIPFGINNSVPDTELTPAEAKQRLGIRGDERTVLFFGAIRPYKGLEYLVEAFRRVSATHPTYRLIIAGGPRKEYEEYLEKIRQSISRLPNPGQVIQRMHFIPDEETELYFKAADVLALPYTHVFQSGVLFLAYNFGLPVIASDVGSVGEDVIEGETGFLSPPCDSCELAKAIQKYFESDLFKNLSVRRQGIRDYANARHSWEIVGEMTRSVYMELGGGAN
jgi:D-inositol-3-phosphate glycosyltransferase